MGIMSRACPACFEAYEQWKGLGTTTTSTTTTTTSRGNTFGSVSDNNPMTGGEVYTSLGVSKDGGLLSSHNARKSEGRLGQAGNSSSETLGREGNCFLACAIVAIERRGERGRENQGSFVMGHLTIHRDCSFSRYRTAPEISVRDHCHQDSTCRRFVYLIEEKGISPLLTC